MNYHNSIEIVLYCLFGIFIVFAFILSVIFYISVEYSLDPNKIFINPIFYVALAANSKAGANIGVFFMKLRSGKNYKVDNFVARISDIISITISVPSLIFAIAMLYSSHWDCNMILVHLASTSIVIVTKDVNMVFALFSFVYPSYYLYALRQAIILLDRQNTSKA